MQLIKTWLPLAAMGLLIVSCFSRQQHKEIRVSPNLSVKPSLDAQLADTNTDCMGSKFDLERFLYKDVAQKIEAQKLLYNGSEPAKLQDCSGIFHRVLQKVEAKVNKQCPRYIFPSLSERSSRALATWYHKQGNLVLVGEPAQMGHLIRPGSVVFFGQRNKRYEKPNMAEIAGSRGANHVGLVVSVERDANGKVLNYGLFHGHGKAGIQPADITHYHRWKTNYLAYGNGSEQLIAVANILTEK